MKFYKKLREKIGIAILQKSCLFLRKLSKSTSSTSWKSSEQMTALKLWRSGSVAASPISSLTSNNTKEVAKVTIICGFKTVANGLHSIQLIRPQIPTPLWRSPAKTILNISCSLAWIRFVITPRSNRMLTDSSGCELL